MRVTSPNLSRLKDCLRQSIGSGFLTRGVCIGSAKYALACMALLQHHLFKPVAKAAHWLELVGWFVVVAFDFECLDFSLAG